jgi:hypothetical protein
MTTPVPSSFRPVLAAIDDAVVGPANSFGFMEGGVGGVGPNTYARRPQ